jgi:hypothetical protein
MSLSSQIMAKLGMNIEAFKNGLSLASTQVSRFGDQTGAILKKKFNLGDAFKGVLQGIGIASVQGIADALVAPFKAAAEQASRMADASEQTADSVERMIALRQTEQQQLDTLISKQQRLNAEIGKPAELGFLRDTLAKIAEAAGFYGISLKLANNEAANTAKLAEDIRKNQLAAEEVDKKRLSIEKAAAAEKKRADDEALRALNEQYKRDEQRAAAVKQLTDFEKTERRAKLSDEQLLGELTADQARLAKEIGSYESFRRQQGELSAAGAADLLALKQQQKSVEEEIADVTARKIAAEKTIGEVVESNIQKWRGFSMEIQTFGRADKDLTDAELQKKRDNLNADIFQRRRRERESGAFAGQNYIDPLLVQQRNQLAQVQAELQLRSQVRGRADFFGAERAFQQFGGTEQRFNDILNGRPPEDTTLLREIRDTLKDKGIAVRSLPNQPPLRP